jgi:hypothetical protein
MKSQAEKDFQATLRKPSASRCQICGNPDGIGPDGKQHRLLNAGDGHYECNYCSNQSTDETIRGVGNRYRGFQVIQRSSNGAATQGFDDHFEREGSLQNTIDEGNQII